MSRPRQAVLEGRIDPVRHLASIEKAIDTQLDGAGGRPAIVLSALREAAPAFRAAESSRSLRSDRRLELRIRPAILQAIAYHRLGSANRLALKWAYTAMFELEKAAHGKARVFEALGSPAPNAVGEQGVAIGAILAATLRRVPDLNAESHRQLVDQCRALFGAYALRGREPTSYPRTPAFAAQCLYLLIDEGSPDDNPLIEALYRLDVATRPTHARGQATVELRNHAYARHRGDLAAADRHAKAAIVDLEGFGLVRHLSVIARQAYLAT